MQFQAVKSIVHDDTDSTIQDEIENSHDSECEFPGQDAGGEIIAQLTEKFHSTDERSERVRFLNMIAFLNLQNDYIMC